jgi:hypothetical protein
MPHEEIQRYLRDGRTRMFLDVLFAEAASTMMGGLSKLGQLSILKISKLVSWLKPSLEIEINFGQPLMHNHLMPLRLWNAKIRSSSTLTNSLHSILRRVLLIFIDEFPLMENSRI